MTVLAADEVAARYGRARDRLIDHLRELPFGAGATPVPSCPGWTVRDVVAHLSGLVADVIADVPPPLGTDAMTSRQVAERAALGLDEICDEWAANASAIVPFLTDVPLRGLGLTADLAVHAHDLAEAGVGVGPPTEETTRTACERYVPALQERAVGLDLALSVNLEGRTWSAEGGATPLRLSASPTDFLRCVTGRRTRDDAERALRWEGDPTALLTRAFTQYGPVRSA